jgi:hypothetical protein
MKRTFTLIALAGSISLVPAALAQQGQSDPAARHAAPAGARTTAESPAYSGRTATVRGEIESVDRETRTITLKDKEGRISMLRAGPDMPGFEQFAKGAKVVVRYSEAVLLSIGKPGVAPQTQVDATPPRRPAPGGQPTMQGVQQTQTTAKVTEIDAGNNTVRLSAPNGEELRMNVRNKADLTGLEKGDEVTVSYIEAFALSVNEDDGSSNATADEDKSSGTQNPQPPRRRQ